MQHNRDTSEDGFTLIELLIVVIIIGILAAIALPIFLNQQKAANDARVQSDVRNTVDNVATWQVQNTTGGSASGVGSSTGVTITQGPTPLTNLSIIASAGDTVNVNITTDGSVYVVTGYRTSGKDGGQYNGPSGDTNSKYAYQFNSASGQFAKVNS